MTFGERLRQIRLKDGETPKSAARYLDVSLAYPPDGERRPEASYA